MTLQNLRTDFLAAPISVENPAPSFSYEIISERAGDRQKEYRLTVTNGNTEVFDSGWVLSPETLNIEYSGEPLSPHTLYEWKISSRSMAGDEASASSAFRTGFLSEAFSGKWICASTDPAPNTTSRLRRSFTASEEIASAYAYICAPSFFDFYVNGEIADQRKFTPAQASGEKRIYEAYRITEKLKQGENTLGILFGDGYHKGSFAPHSWVYECEKRAIAEIIITYKSGKVEVITTDEDWEGACGSHLRESTIYHGEFYDGEALSPGSIFDTVSDKWEKATPLDYPTDNIICRPVPDVKVIEYLDFERAWQTADGGVVLDFGQNIAGYVSINYRGARGERLRITHAEEIFPESGELDCYTNRNAKAEDNYIFSGEDKLPLEPHFTYHGFRYAKIEGLKKIPEKGQFRGAIIHADMEFTLDFECDNAQLQRLYKNAVFSVRGNSMSYPSDCTMRDERTPCAMDLAAYVKFALCLWAAESFVKFFMRNTQKTDYGHPEWSGSQVMELAELYRHYQSKKTLREFYPVIKSYVHACEEKWGDGVCEKYFGDWCAPTNPPSADYLTSFSSVKETGTALMYLQAKEFREMARIMGEAEDERWASERMETVARAYEEAFFDKETGRYLGGSITPVILPLAFGMIPEERAVSAAATVVELIKEKGGHLDTGIFGTRYFTSTLADYGYLDVALDALLNKSYPGFGYQLERGATTLWEQWLEKGDMSSHNHAMFAGSLSFVVESLMGLKSSRDAHREVVLEPKFSEKINEMKVRLKTARGAYELAYKKADGNATLAVTVPFGCEATLLSPKGEAFKLNSGTHSLNIKI